MAVTREDILQELQRRQGMSEASPLPDVAPASREDIQSELDRRQNAPGLVEGGMQSLLQGATLGFSDEIQSLIAAAVASPFVSDKTFGQLMVDARKSFREQNEAFKEENPKTALGLELAGGLATGGAATGAGVARAGLTGAATTGAAVGGVAGAGFADQDELVSPETAQESLEGAALGFVTGPLTLAGIKAAAQAGRAIPKDMPRKLLESALKIPPRSVDKATRANMVDTALREGIMPTVKGLQKIANKLQVLNDDIDDIIDSATDRGVKIPKKALFTKIQALKNDLGGAKLDAASDVKKIDQVVDAFDEQLEKIGKRMLTPREVQTLKQDAYKRINFDLQQGKASFAKNETRKAIAKGAKESLEKMDPNIKPKNQRMGNLIELNDELEKVVNRLDNRNLLSLDTGVKVGAGAATGTAEGVGAGVLASVLGAPRVKAKIALLLENLRVLPRTEGAINQLPGELAAPLMVLFQNTKEDIESQIEALND